MPPTRPYTAYRCVSASLALLVGVGWAGAATAQQTPAPEGPGALQADSLRLEPLIQEALERNPSLLAIRSSARAVETRVEEQGTLPDPVLEVGAMNVGLMDFDVGMPASMAPSIQLSQRFPAPGVRGLREEVAEARSRAVGHGVVEAAWLLRAEVASSFHALYALDRTLEVHQRTLGLLGDFQSVARALYASGSGQQGDALRADVEVARMDAEIRRVSALRAAEAARLNALVDRPEGTPVPPTARPRARTALPVQDTLVAWAVRNRPSLARRRAELEGAQKAVELADRSRWPDLMVSAQYGRRWGDSPRHMGGLMLGASLPIHAGSRQSAFVEAAEAEALSAEAEVSASRAQVAAEVIALLAEIERAGSLLDLYRDEILPVARVNVASSFASYRVGSVDFSTLVNAQLDVDRYEIEYHTLEADYGVALNRLEAALGGFLPATGASSTGSMPEEP